jgi:hypothetical protein
LLQLGKGGVSAMMLERAAEAAIEALQPIALDRRA